MRTIKVLSSILTLLFVLTLTSNNANAQTAAKDSKYETMALKVEMTCNTCKNAVEKCLAYEKGVKSFDVNLDAKKVTIKYNKDKTTAEKIKKSVAKLGYATSDYKTAGCKSKAPCSKAPTKCCSKKKS